VQNSVSRTIVTALLFWGMVVASSILASPVDAAPQPYRFPQPLDIRGYAGGFLGYAHYGSDNERVREGAFTIGVHLGAERFLHQRTYIAIHTHIEWDTMGFDESCLHIETAARITEQCLEFESEFSGAIAGALGYQLPHGVRLFGRIGWGYTYAARNLERTSRDKVRDTIITDEDTLDSEFFTGLHASIGIAIPNTPKARRATALEVSFNDYGDSDSLYDIDNRFSIIVSQTLRF